MGTSLFTGETADISLRVTDEIDNPWHLENRPLALGIDLGGTKTEAIILAPEGTVLDRWRVASAVGNYDATLRLIRDMAADARTRFGPLSSIGIGIPGTLSSTTGRVKNANSTWLNGRALHQDLITVLEQPVAIANDADCFALSEATDGAGMDAKSVWGLILGTGVGSGIVIDGHLLSGPNAIAGEWGHVPLPWPTDTERPGPTCYCGKHGCIETFLSGPGLAADHRAHGGEDQTASAIAAAATNGDPIAQATMARYLDRLARATAMVITILDPDVIVLGGGISNIPMLYERLPNLWPRYVFSDDVNTRLSAPRFGDSSGVRGAAWLGKASRQNTE
ncbi:MAG: ROK family protein [Rhodospirillaceae bacterium]|nr:ROK family protein [Rhodospirillaceae bacterium]